MKSYLNIWPPNHYMENTLINIFHFLHICASSNGSPCNELQCKVDRIFNYFKYQCHYTSIQGFQLLYQNKHSSICVSAEGKIRRVRGQRAESQSAKQGGPALEKHDYKTGIRRLERHPTFVINSTI